MKKIKLSAFLLALCILLCACTQNGTANVTNDPPVSGNEQTQIPDNDSSTPPDSETPGTDDRAQIVYPAELRVELVVEWETADSLLSHLDELADQLRIALEEAGCPLDRVTLTISTAGGFTAQALLDGGIDAAILPAVDIIAHENNALILALSSEDIAEYSIAVSTANDDLTEAFCLIFRNALTQTSSGQDVLAACCGDAVFSPPTEDTLQAVRDYFRELEESEGGRIG